LHRAISSVSDFESRSRQIADAFLGLPYIENSLIGGPKQPEKLVVNLEAFDCVTFVENVIALARSRSEKGFLDELTKTRYKNGKVSWSSRLHYFSDWMKHNEKRGAIRVRTRGAGSRAIDKTVGFIEGLRTRRVRFHIVPKKEIRSALPRLPSGSIVAFASVRSKLDFFHTGFLFSDFKSTSTSSIDHLLLYQAQKGAGKVIAQPLAEFLKLNRMKGIAFATPTRPSRLK
jgi:hypothetical protein